jgi:hypothetical protein
MPQAFNTDVVIEEIEGADRIKVTLNGRALPQMDSPPEWGVRPMGEITNYRGRLKAYVEPTTVTYPDLKFVGAWKQLHFLTGAATIRTENAGFAGNPGTPHEAVQLFEQLARRGKRLLVTWSGGAQVECTFINGGFTWTPFKGVDRKWTMDFKVLAPGDAPTPTPPTRVLSVDEAITAFRNMAFALDRMMASAPKDLMNEGFFTRVRDSIKNARGKLAEMRKRIRELGDFAKQPAGIMREFNNLVHDVKATFRDARATYDDVAWEYQVVKQGPGVQLAVETWDFVKSGFDSGDGKTSFEKTKTFFGAATKDEPLTAGKRRPVPIGAAFVVFRWRARMLASFDGVADALFSLESSIALVLPPPKKYISTSSGSSLYKIAVAQYGDAESWVLIADANGIVGPRVPDGMSQLVIPELPPARVQTQSRSLTRPLVNAIESIRNPRLVVVGSSSS